jgi:CubicO group peptidase (beta-lactamase class C family)
MRAIALLLGLFLSFGAAGPASACVFLPLATLGDDSEAAPLPPYAKAIDEALGEGFPGEVQLYRDGMTYHARAPEACESNEWPWASVTKQVVATLVMQEVERGTIALDAPAIAYLRFPAAGDLPSPTVRDLLQHRSGLRNPDDSDPDANGVPDFYSTGPTGLEWCLEGRSAPPSEGWRYNNCDFIALGAILEEVTGTPVRALIAERLRAAGVTGVSLLARQQRSLARYSDDFPTDISRYGASGALVGPLSTMIEFDKALMAGRLLSPEARNAMWSGDPALGYMALGQWAYTAPLAGCPDPVRIVERRGAIGDYQVRNFILPDDEIALAVAVRDADLDFGELWQGQGRSHDLLSAAACGASE